MHVNDTGYVCVEYMACVTDTSRLSIVHTLTHTQTHTANESVQSVARNVCEYSGAFERGRNASKK